METMVYLRVSCVGAGVLTVKKEHHSGVDASPAARGETGHI